MTTLSISSVRDNLSSTIDKAEQEPIIIQKNNKDVAVLVSATRFKEMKRVEDMLYVKMAEMAAEEGFASKEESEDLLNSIREA